MWENEVSAFESRIGYWLVDLKVNSHIGNNTVNTSGFTRTTDKDNYIH